MSNWIDYRIDVLANSPSEINQVAERLNQPSPEIAHWIAQRDGQPMSEIAEALKGLLEFKTERNLGYVHPEVNRARRFSLEFTDRQYGIVDSHLIEVSRTFPEAVFLVEYFDTQASYSGKRVIRAGEFVQEVFDGDQQAQGLDWALLDIFAPFRTEYYGEYEFGSLWQRWVDAMLAAVTSLKKEPTLAKLASESV
jgi:hypothetical protein